MNTSPERVETPQLDRHLETEMSGQGYQSQVQTLRSSIKKQMHDNGAQSAFGRPLILETPTGFNNQVTQFQTSKSPKLLRKGEQGYSIPISHHTLRGGLAGTIMKNYRDQDWNEMILAKQKKKLAAIATTGEQQMTPSQRAGSMISKTCSNGFFSEQVSQQNSRNNLHHKVGKSQEFNLLQMQRKKQESNTGNIVSALATLDSFCNENIGSAAARMEARRNLPDGFLLKMDGQRGRNHLYRSVNANPVNSFSMYKS